MRGCSQTQGDTRIYKGMEKVKEIRKDVDQ